MFGCYRKDEVADPEFYLTAAVAILSRYQKQTILRITDPRTGLPASSKFLPSIAEIREACEREQATFDREAARQERLREQLRGRQEDEKIEAARSKRPTYDELKAKSGKNWGLQISEPENENIVKQKRELAERANRVFFERECAAAGVSSTQIISPSLAAILKEQRKLQSETINP